MKGNMIMMNEWRLLLLKFHPSPLPVIKWNYFRICEDIVKIFQSQNPLNQWCTFFNLKSSFVAFLKWITKHTFIEVYCVPLHFRGVFNIKQLSVNGLNLIWVNITEFVSAFDKLLKWCWSFHMSQSMGNMRKRIGE